ncbi:unnamed protein product [Euphydryas editha]|uniref:BTB domain-containing protein n=1 Tax=Euphydryas editha TaxID=104508 RepID=A0AAU9UYJ0_EUPED|nr:unnamed protein product [Euphydryas editha]
MFYGPLSTNEVITISDIEPKIFQLLLNYIYTDKVEIHSIEESYDLLYVSRKYMLDYLTEICISYIKSNISIDNVISVLNYPDHMQANQLVSTALKLFCQHAEYFLKEYKCQINSTCMQRVLNCNEINILEKDLIKYVFGWTSLYCEQNEIKNNCQNRRNILSKSGLMKLLRFFTLTPKELEEITACKDNLLLTYEKENLKEAISCKNSVNKNVISNFDNKLSPRKPIKLQWCLCYRSPIRSESPLIIDLTKHTLHTKIKANKSTFINSLSVHSRMAPSISYCYDVQNIYYEQFTISVMCLTEKKIIKKIDFKNHVEYDSNIDIEFDEPLLIKKDSWYKISFVWPEPNTFYSYIYAVQSRDPSYSNGKIRFEFDDFLSISDHGGSFLKGLKFCM